MKYRKGYEFERKVRKFFESRPNFICTIRSAGSKGLIDLMIMLHGMCYLIQCKKGKKISKQELLELKALEQHIHSWSDSFQILIAYCADRSHKIEFHNLSGELQEHF